MAEADETCAVTHTDEKLYELDTPRSGKIKVHVQGDLDNAEKKAVFLTVHDIGNNHSNFWTFVTHPSMTEIKQRSVFLHVDIPGQDDHADDLPADFVYPTIQTLGEDLVSILDQLKVKLVVGFGEGAGANILVRFTLAHADRVLGLILIHCVATAVGMMEYFKDRYMNWKLTRDGVDQTTEQFLVMHKFGAQLDNVENKDALIQEYTEKLKRRINPRNLRRYVEAYMNRKDIMSLVESQLRSMDVLLVSGSKATHAQSVLHMYMKMDKQKTSFLKVDQVGDVLAEAPEKLAQSLHLFVKGLGFLTSVTLPGVERQKTHQGGGIAHKSLGAVGRRRTLSMEDYDSPRQRGTSPKAKAQNAEKSKERAAEKPKERAAEKPKERAAEKPKERAAEKQKERATEKPKECAEEKPKDENSEKPKDENSEKSKGQNSENPENKK
ncbi:uncharacterized protein ZK1073.1-like [Argiope bruennichi]|uniref:uncharacterized protein ZK1073.1-like n=1 Tax=Argiope bruennichi TaxID=94029 RepID=UPI0024940651|nr:uncharacterized protein ZK1073.1-like [Argiope bruennichi]